MSFRLKQKRPVKKKRHSIATPHPIGADVRAQRRNTKRDALLRGCASLAGRSDLLAEFDVAVAQAGLVGEKRNAKVILLALVSRAFPRPVSLVVKGARSGGKNTLVDKVLKFFPSSAYFILTGMSEKALARFKTPLKNRFLVVNEAAGIKEGGDYFLRSLLSEGYLKYEVTAGKSTNTLEIEGPTGLIMTTTQVKLYDDDESRLFSLDVADTPEQTRKVLKAIGKNFANGVGAKPVPVPKEWPQLLEMIAVDPPLVVIPFAESVVALLPKNDTRLRRDTNAMLTLVQSHALLHMQNRAVRPNGHLEAELCDYAAVRSLVRGIMARGVGLAVSKAVRKTVDAVVRLTKDGNGVTANRLCKELNLHKSNVSRHIHDAMLAGYVRNLNEGKKEASASYVAGDPIPDDSTVLPKPEAVARHLEKSATRAAKKVKTVG